ncbi:MAG: hypothetical protein JJU46_00800 [Balneolaceae bacterium]|nr:hypothetical protein [Balneolaceae bacterium]MCH8550258.1 hypothetical protein [Balneolaceae bacterium]
MEWFEEGHYYHIYNRGVGKGTIFWSDKDFRRFIKKYVYYLYPSVQTFAWCLLSNHFHALIRVRTVAEQSRLFNLKKEHFLSDKLHGNQDPLNKPFVASRQISHLMNSYTRYINCRKERTGFLFEGSLKRKRVIDDDNFQHLVCYIHRNPIHHGIVNDYRGYKYSSINDFLIGRRSFVEVAKVLEDFGGRENFLHAHEEFKMKIDDGETDYLE